MFRHFNDLQNEYFPIVFQLVRSRKRREHVRLRKMIVMNLILEALSPVLEMSSYLPSQAAQHTTQPPCHRIVQSACGDLPYDNETLVVHTA